MDRPYPPLLALALLLPALSACDSDELDPEGYHWQVKVSGAVDQCNDDPVAYQESFVYSLFFNGSETLIKIGDEEFAEGLISGCSLEYESDLIGEQRGTDGVWIKWRLTGEAVIRQGGSGCELEEGIDWEGTETFTIEDSEDTGLAEGCTYTMDVVGTYLNQSG